MYFMFFFKKNSLINFKKNFFEKTLYFNLITGIVDSNRFLKNIKNEYLKNLLYIILEDFVFHIYKKSLTNL